MKPPTYEQRRIATEELSVEKILVHGRIQRRLSGRGRGRWNRPLTQNFFFIGNFGWI